MKQLCSIVLLGIIALCPLVRSHSWLACVDYTEKNAETYDHDKCRGYARNSLNRAPRGGTFGQDTGFDFHPSESTPCRDPRNDVTNYDANHPMAVYYTGQQVVLAHPMKNHGSDTCTNKFIPDNGNFIYRNSKETADITLSEFRQNLVANLGIKDFSLPLGQYPRPGYQNAPKFCENTDKSLGTYSFNVPSDLSPGLYTFLWIWAFNSDQDLYSSCFEVQIVGSLLERNALLLANGFSDTYEPCGGDTSDFSLPGNSNPGCTNTDSSTTSTTTSTSEVTTSSTTTTTTTTTPTSSQLLPALHYQTSGEIELGQPIDGTVRRYVNVRWECLNSEIKFWNARITGQMSDSKSVTYNILQEGDDVLTGKITFFASLGPDGCKLLSYPIEATFIRDE